MSYMQAMHFFGAQKGYWILLTWRTGNKWPSRKRNPDSHCGVRVHDTMYRTRWLKRQSFSLEQGKCLVRILTEIPAVVNEVSCNFSSVIPVKFRDQCLKRELHCFLTQLSDTRSRTLGYRLDNRGLPRLRSPDRALNFSLLQNVETVSGAPISLLFIGCRGSLT